MKNQRLTKNLIKEYIEISLFSSLSRKAQNIVFYSYDDNEVCVYLNRGLNELAEVISLLNNPKIDYLDKKRYSTETDSFYSTSLYPVFYDSWLSFPIIKDKIRERIFS